MTDPSAFKHALSQWASGVSVVTTNDDGLLYGLTVSSFTSLSLDPPLVLVCIHNENRMPSMVEQSRRFAVSILASDQQGASNYFAQQARLPTPNFVEIDGEWTESGQPVVAGSLVWMVCELESMVVRGDHTIMIGEVIETGGKPGKPLIYHDRGYRSLAD